MTFDLESFVQLVALVPVAVGAGEMAAEALVGAGQLLGAFHIPSKATRACEGLLELGQLSSNPPGRSQRPVVASSDQFRISPDRRPGPLEEKPSWY